ncbi:MAG TPA: hypothetical protein VM409_04065 [Chloroflexia bacterium]|nr:hypothetical protein [Chloroflexia bacterium]
MVSQAQSASALDLLQNAAESQAFEHIVLVTESETLIAGAMELPAILRGEVPFHVEAALPGPFHFGRSLSHICSKLGLERVVYAGGASMPLATRGHLVDLAAAVGGDGHCVTSNNLFSADVVAFYPASALERISLPAADNDLAWQLHFKAGLPYAPVPRSLASQFDIDTPTDLATLWWSFVEGNAGEGMPGQHLREILSAVPDELSDLARSIDLACRQMATRRAQVMLAGRLGSSVWRRLELNLPCQTRVLSEERGMRASGREERGEAVSLLGLYCDIAGVAGMLRALEKTCDAAFIDSRVLFAHMGLKPKATDRFASDALLPGEIEEPWVWELTEGVRHARIPVVLGGHSLLAGGVWALSERIRGSASAAR